ncbi:hypothetical protein EV11_2018 [Prochlorococcus sp. SS52]|nr:hypothetical protein EV04_0704 [Prochlorococcus marinus str. LG]KGG22465.1 hypothetical protein EV08_0106 [Prochlorococcus marinus str. SS2]KGG23792.1 hypothetical protein EV09_0894 [Prochlorococcus marinus str. SS35]KGG31995.1 hypothetical protein EV10_1109 [Prochlorococcus marinus str. SS51]KGG34475.1 hypothetical protein EV11_2018 [Prochlorococcus sp. SS52]
MTYCFDISKLKAVIKSKINLALTIELENKSDLSFIKKYISWLNNMSGN